MRTITVLVIAFLSSSSAWAQAVPQMRTRLLIRIGVLATAAALAASACGDSGGSTSGTTPAGSSTTAAVATTLTPQTGGLVNAQRLSWLKPTALLLNTSRGQLIDESALAAALNSDRLAGAGLDVLSVEPPAEGNPLLSARNCLVTPHIAWATKEARSRLLDLVVENIAAFLAGKPRNVVG